MTASWMQTRQCAQEKWCSLRDVFRLWNIFDRGDRTIWLQGQGFAATQPGNHIPARAQEFVLSSACRVDARVALLEVVYVQAVHHTAQQMTVPRIRGPVRESHRQHPPRTRNATPLGNGWAELDDIDVEDVFLQHIPMLKSCPRFLRGRLRESFGLRERYRGKQEGDEIAERRGWKLFALVPTLLLHKPRGTGSVGRDELARRADDLAAGRWKDLLAEALWHPPMQVQAPLTERQEELRRVHNAQARIKLGQSFQSKAHPHRSGSGPQDRQHIQLVAG